MPSSFLRVVPPAEPGAGSYRTERDLARHWRMVAIISLVVNGILAFAWAAFIVGSHAWFD